METTSLPFLAQFAGNEGFAHIALVVRDIRRAAADYAALLGVPEPLVKQTNPPDTAKVMFMGAPSPARALQTFVNMGGLRIELMQPDEHPSTWKQVLDENGEGLHHAGYFTDDFEKTLSHLEAAGMPVVQTGFYNGGRYAYIDSRKRLGMMLEVLHND